MKFLGRFPWHPLFFSIFPVISLYAYNSAEVPFKTIGRALLICLTLGLVIWGLLSAILKNPSKAALITTLFMLLYFSYGQVLDALGRSLPGLARHRYLLLAWGILFAVGAALILFKLRRTQVLTQMLNFSSAGLALLLVVQILSPMLAPLSGQKARATDAVTQNLQVNPALGQPDIYYIILDMYGRSDSLQNDFQVDNSAFIQSLRQLGFYVADCSLSNYAFTVLSLSSSLNMNYLTDFTEAQYLPKSSESWFPAGRQTYLGSFIKHNPVRTNLERLGYKFAEIETAWNWLNAPDADYYLTMSDGTYFNNFEDMVLSTTLLRMPWEWIQKLDPQISLQETIRRQLFILDRASSLPELTGPKFTFLHIAIPHPPFVFAEDGTLLVNDPRFSDPSQITKEAYRVGYANQVGYISQRILPILEQIIKNSKSAPIIILQGDHGPNGSAAVRMPILNAYYLPGMAAQKLYPSITPVNTFRLIFDEYFSAGYKLLDDISYTNPTGGTNFQFEVFHDTWPACKQKVVAK